jgi:hypothetical protein
MPAVWLLEGGHRERNSALFLDVQVDSPARLLARGAAVEVPLEVTCNAIGTVDVQVTVTQHSGSGATQGFGSAQVGCTGSGQRVSVVVQVFGAKAFKKGTAVATAEVFGCNNVTCGSETDTEVIDIQR